MTLIEIQLHLKQETKYSRLYLNIILKSIIQNRVKLRKNQTGYIYFEAHHILPKSLFKEFSCLKTNPWNKVLLTAKEHFICHVLIWKHYKSLGYTRGEMKMGRAMLMLNNFGKYNSNMYETHKITIKHSEETKRKIGDANRGIKLGSKATEETRSKMSVSRKGHFTSEETKEKIRDSNLGLTRSEETKRRISEAVSGRVLSVEHKRKIRENNKSKELSLTIHIFNNNGVLQHIIDTTFIPYCKLHSLPYKVLQKSYRTNSKLYQTDQGLSLAKKSGNDKFVGWYAVKVS